MNMQIKLKKLLSKPSVLTITRTDGSSTYSKMNRGLETHDLAHYAVEKELKFTKAFYSIIDKGYNISDFELPKDKRPFAVRPENLHAEALITEHIVNLLEVELLNSGLNENFIEAFKTILEEHQLPFPEKFNTGILEAMRLCYHNLVNQWLALNENESMQITLIIP